MEVSIESLGLLQSQEIMKELGDRDLIKAFADPAVAINRRVVRRLKSSTRYQDQTGALRRGWSARRTPARYNTVRGDSDATRLSTIFSASPVIQILEGGTKERRTRSGRRTGRVSPRSIVETAVQATQPEVVPEYAGYLNGPRGLDRVIRRAVKRKPRKDRR